MFIFLFINSVSVVGELAVAKMAEADTVDVEKKNEEGEANVEEKSQEDLIKESIAAAVMKVFIRSCGHWLNLIFQWPGRKWARRKDPKKGVMLKLLDDVRPRKLSWPMTIYPEHGFEQEKLMKR